MATQYALKDIRLPALYIRSKGPDPAHVQDMVDHCRDMKEWALPAIVLRKVDPDKKNPEPYEVTDGVHRVLAAKALGMKDIPGVLRSYASATDVLADQIKTNLHGGVLALTRADRDNGIRLLKSEGVESKVIAEKVGLSIVSVNRIIKQKQGTGETGARRVAAKRRKKGKKGKRGASRSLVTPGQMTVEQWFSDVEILVGSFKVQGPAIVEARGMVSPDTLAHLFDVGRCLITGEESIPDWARPVADGVPV